MKTVLCSIMMCAVVLSMPLGASGAGPQKSRDFRFTYEAVVKGLQPGQTARIWLPVPPTNEQQIAKIVAQRLPAEPRIAREPRFGNDILYLEAKADAEGKIPVAVTYLVKRKEIKGERKENSKEKEDPGIFLKPDAKVPVDGKPLTLLEGKDLPQDQFQLARLLYDVVDNHMRYSKEGVGWGQGDAVWACDSKFGNCSDFHSLFISLSRSQKIPATFEIGFPLPEKRGQGELAGYHCWAWFKPDGKGWVPVDISEANKNPQMKDYYFGNLTENRVTFSTGRDLELVPRQDGPPLNFFIYPYAEVNGRPWADSLIQRHFTYQDVN